MESNGLDGLAEEEIEAVQTLLRLEETYVKTWHFNKWSRRRKRSALNAAAPPAIQRSEKPSGVSAGREPEVRHSNSPVSPFEFADEKDKPRPAKAAKMTTTRKDCAEMIEELTKTKQVLIGEIENARKRRNELLAYNTELKAMKEEALKKKEGPQTDINLALELSQYYQTPTVMAHHRRPYIPDPTAQSLPSSAAPQAQPCSSNNELGSTNRVGPRGFDLNLLPEEYVAAAVEEPQTVEMADRRARSADARRRRKGMMKIKNMRSACGIKLPSDE